jgi:hypothetical protein
MLTHVGKYQGEVVTANIVDEPRPANYEAVPTNEGRPDEGR